jgi:hypothetical protein
MPHHLVSQNFFSAALVALVVLHPQDTGGTTLGFATAAHGFLMELGASNPGDNTITYVDVTTNTDNTGTLLNAPTCTGTIKTLCDSTR